MPGLFQAIENYIGWTFSQFTWSSVIDIGLVTMVFFALLYAVRGTQAVQLARGLIVVALIGLAAPLTTVALVQASRFRSGA